ncbi:MAG: recombination mediator RecR [Oscillospiraceae bacterium]|jgi:recombination protein RecR|nr:recombination mediator RecR [Oscillospiraceae bacterium]
MPKGSAALAELTDWFHRLPGVGAKTAQRLAYYVLTLPVEQAQGFADAILSAHEKIHRCPKCCDFTDSELCGVCAAPSRDTSLICVVETPRDVIALERTHEYGGVYHVLHGAISPLSGVRPQDLTVAELLKRLDDGIVREVIMATNPTVEGEATAMYLSRLIKPLGVQVSRLAYGIPVGASLEYADEVTLLRALEGRKEL